MLATFCYDLSLVVAERAKQAQKMSLLSRLFVTTSISTLLSLIIWISYQDHPIYGGGSGDTTLKSALRPPASYLLKPNLINLPGCCIPNIDPFTDEVKSYYKARLHLRCLGKPSFLSTVNDTTVVVDHVKLWKLRKVKLKHCYYVAIVRSDTETNNPDDSVMYKPRNNSKFTQKVRPSFLFTIMDHSKRNGVLLWTPVGFFYSDCNGTEGEIEVDYANSTFKFTGEITSLVNVRN